MRLQKFSGTLLILTFFLIILLCGCVQTTTSKNLTSVESPTPDVTSSLPADFSVNISQDGQLEINITRMIVKNFSDIKAHDYSDIPVLLNDNITYLNDDNRYSTYFCGYNPASNYSRVSEVAFNDPRVQDMLRDGAIVEGIFYYSEWMSHTKEESMHPCEYMYIAMYILYKGHFLDIAINETTQRVIFPNESLQYINTPR